MGGRLEVDLQYPEYLHDAQSNYPPAGEKFSITRDMLSPYSASLIDKHVPSEKLSPNLYDKTKYVLHYENLRFYLKHGLQLIKILPILKFRQSAWMKPCIDFNTAERQESLYTSLNNMVSGKTMECLRRRIDLELVTNPTRAKKLIAKPTTQHWDIITDNMVAIKKQKPKIFVNKPIYLGSAS